MQIAGMAATWYALQESVSVGPIDANALIKMCREGSVTPHTMVWRNGSPCRVAQSL